MQQWHSSIASLISWNFWYFSFTCLMPSSWHLCFLLHVWCQYHYVYNENFFCYMSMPTYYMFISSATFLMPSSSWHLLFFCYKSYMTFIFGYMSSWHFWGLNCMVLLLYQPNICCCFYAVLLCLFTAGLWYLCLMADTSDFLEFIDWVSLPG